MKTFYALLRIGEKEFGTLEAVVSNKIVRNCYLQQI